MSRKGKGINNQRSVEYCRESYRGRICREKGLLEKMEKMGEMGVSVWGKWEESEKQKRRKMVRGQREGGWEKEGGR